MDRLLRNSLSAMTCRKNYMFVGSVCGGNFAVILYAISGDDQDQQRQYTGWFPWILERITGREANRVGGLLP